MSTAAPSCWQDECTRKVSYHLEGPFDCPQDVPCPLAPCPGHSAARDSCVFHLDDVVESLLVAGAEPVILWGAS